MEKSEKILSVRRMAIIGVLSALATIVMIFEVPLWFAPGFYKLDFSEVIVLIGAFALGPVAGITIEFLKVLLNFFINWTVTMGVGELANFLIGCAFIVPASVIYKKHKTRKGAIIGMLIGILTMSLVGGPVNYFVILPAYSYFMNLDLNVIIEMGSKLNSSITDLKTFVVLATVPFNLLKGFVSALITLLMYKNISKFIHKKS